VVVGGFEYLDYVFVGNFLRMNMTGPGHLSTVYSFSSPYCIPLIGCHRKHPAVGLPD